MKSNVFAKLICLFFTVGQLVCATAARADVKMPFRLGFEFQENSSLCKEAGSNNLVQKQSIFIVKDSEGNKLWHLEIDTDDVEFVTEPFDRTQESSLNLCIKSILLSVKILSEELNKIKKITILTWRKVLESKLREIGCLVEDGSLASAHSLNLEKPPIDTWTPRFSPQATIQHPLEFTISLCFNLFGFDRPDYTMPFVASLPGVDGLEAAIKNGDSTAASFILNQYITNKLCGIAFLHALALVRMTPDESSTDRDLLKETADCFGNSGQVDAKMKLPLMSRRPFSKMWQEVRGGFGDDASYSKSFNAMFEKNRSFSRTYKVPALFDRANYGEHFFEPDGTIKDLSHFKMAIDQSFFAQNSVIISGLLKQGILSTTIARHLKVIDPRLLGGNNLLQNYYLRSIESVDNPERMRFQFDGRGVQYFDWQYDILSPPLLQDQSNSMGYFKMDTYGLRYGEAIVEIRAIKDVALRFFVKSKLDTNRVGNFLTDHENFIVDVMALFDFLDTFGNKNNLDFYTGVHYSILRGRL